MFEMLAAVAVGAASGTPGLLAATALMGKDSSRVNDEGAVVKRGTDRFAHLGDDGTNRWYCGRLLGQLAIPGSDGQCGPDGGPQCASCRRFQRKKDSTEEAGQRVAEQQATLQALQREEHRLTAERAAVQREAQRLREEQEALEREAQRLAKHRVAIEAWQREAQHRAAVEARHREEQREAEERAAVEALQREAQRRAQHRATIEAPAWAAKAPQAKVELPTAGVAANDAQARRITDVDVEAVLDFSPIVGVGKAPLLPVLDAAVATGVEDMDSFGFIASETGARLAKDDPHGLDKDEAGAVYLYSMESELYKSMNKLLRHRNRDGLRPYFSLLRLLLAAKHKLPVMQGTVWRGVKANLAGKFSPGLEFYWWSFTSTTKDVAVLEKPEFLGNAGERTIFNIQMLSGREITRYSFLGSAEAEVLLFPGTKLRVLSCANLGANLHIVHLEELDIKVQLLK